MTRNRERNRRRKNNRKRQQPEEKKKETESKKKPEAVPASVDGGRPESTTQATTLSPGVRRIVEEEKLEPEKITGTGQGGRLTKADVLKAVENRGKAEPSEVAVAKAEEKSEPREVQPPATLASFAKRCRRCVGKSRSNW